MAGDGSGMSSAPENDEALFQPDNFSSNLLRSLQDMKSQEQLCDVALLVGGRVFRAHRVVLAAVSPVFRAMFTSQMTEAKQEQIPLPELEAEAFEELLGFAYSGQVRVSLDSAESLMSAAAFLQINAVVEFCAGFFQTRLQMGNVLNIREIADRLNCSTLMEAADRFIQKYFVILSKTAEFRCLSQEDLSRILIKDELFVSSEEQVLDALMCWVGADPGVRGEQLGTLLPCVRLPLLSSEVLADCIRTHPLMGTSLQCLTMLHAAKDYKFIPSRRSLLQTFQTTPRCCKDAPGLIYVVGGSDKDFQSLSSVEVFDPLVGCWSSIQPMKTPRAYVAVAVMDGLLYAIGGFNRSGPLRSVEVFHPRSGRWEEVALLNKWRYGACAAVVDNRLFVCGGRDGRNRLSSVEVFEGGRWTLTSPMHHRRSAAGVAVLDGKVYMIGGYDGQQTLGSVERLDSETMQWRMVQPMRTPRALPGTCSLDGCLFVCGGWDRPSRRLRSVEMYNPSKDEWADVPSMNEARSGVSLVSISGCLFAIGESNDSGSLSSMEIFKPAEDVWRSGPNLETPRRVASAVVVPIPPEELLP